MRLAAGNSPALPRLRRLFRLRGRAPCLHRSCVGAGREVVQDVEDRLPAGRNAMQNRGRVDADGRVPGRREGTPSLCYSCRGIVWHPKVMRQVPYLLQPCTPKSRFTEAMQNLRQPESTDPQWLSEGRQAHMAAEPGKTGKTWQPANAGSFSAPGSRACTVR